MGDQLPGYRKALFEETRSMTSSLWGRSIIGLVLAAIAPSFLLAIPSLIAGRLAEALSPILMVLAASSTVAILFGLPVVVIFNLSGLVEARWYMLAGVIAGLGLSAYFVLPSISIHGFAQGAAAYSMQIAILVALSIAAAMCYWAFVRPDRYTR